MVPPVNVAVNSQIPTPMISIKACCPATNWHAADGVVKDSSPISGSAEIVTAAVILLSPYCFVVISVMDIVREAKPLQIAYNVAGFVGR